MSDHRWFKFWASDYLTDANVAKVPPEGRELLIRMWCVCNLRGSAPADTEELAVATGLKISYVSKWLSELLSERLSHPLFELRGGMYFSPRMERDKRKSAIARENAQKNENKGGRGFAEQIAKQSAEKSAEQMAQLRKLESQRAREEIQNLSPNFSLSPANGNGGNGHPDPAQKQALLKVWDHYIKKTGRSEIAYRLTEKRSKVGMLRLKECQKRSNGNLDEAVNLMNLAVDKLTASNFHMGQNDTGKKYNDWIDNLFKSEEQMEKWWNA